MSTLELSRIQFGLTTMFHFIFVPLILGLSVLVAVMETRYVRSGSRLYLKMTKFWGRLFLINFALGVVTGLFLEFEFGMNWSRFSGFAGDVFGAPLAIESLFTFSWSHPLSASGCWAGTASPEKHTCLPPGCWCWRRTSPPSGFCWQTAGCSTRQAGRSSRGGCAW